MKVLKLTFWLISPQKVSKYKHIRRGLTLIFRVFMHFLFYSWFEWRTANGAARWTGSGMAWWQNWSTTKPISSWHRSKSTQVTSALRSEAKSGGIFPYVFCQHLFQVVRKWSIFLCPSWRLGSPSLWPREPGSSHQLHSLSLSIPPGTLRCLLIDPGR